jgi:hypothetical protein
MTNFVQPYELNDAELDLVAAGQARGVAFAAGLVAAAVAAPINVSDIDIDVRNVLSSNDVDVNVLRNVLNDSNVNIGAILNVLGGPAVLRQVAAAV